MEKIIKIDLVNEEDLYEKYNKEHVSKDLINYLVEKVSHFSSNDVVKIIINNNIKNKDVITLIQEGLKNFYHESIIKSNQNNILEIIYFILGIIALFISTLLERTIFKEIVLIWGWVLIWEMIELEIFSDIRDRKKRKILKKLLNSEMIENKI